MDREMPPALMVEVADRDTLFNAPRHRYTRALLDAVPVADPEANAATGHDLIIGEVPSVRNPPAGCRFHPRCREALAECAHQAPQLKTMSDERLIACHLHH